MRQNLSRHLLMFRLASKKCVEIQIWFIRMYFPSPFQIRAMMFYQFCMNYFTFTLLQKNSLNYPQNISKFLHVLLRFKSTFPLPKHTWFLQTDETSHINDASDTISFSQAIDKHTYKPTFSTSQQKFIIGHLFKRIVLQECDFIEENNNIPSKAVEVKNSVPPRKH